ADLVGVDLADPWRFLGSALRLDPDLLRLVVFGAVDLAAAFVIVRTLRPRFPRRARARAPFLPLALRAVYGGGVLVSGGGLGVGLVLQPTLVPLRLDRGAWIERAANLVDGTASAGIVDAVAWVVHVLVPPQPAVAVAPVRPEAFEADLDDAVIPLVDRWDAA